MSDHQNYRRQAQQHAPKDPAAVASTIRSLAAQGLGTSTISHVLQLDPVIVAQALGERGKQQR